MIDSSLEEALSKALGVENVSTRLATLDRYSTDALTPSRAFDAAPRMDALADLVVTPHSVEQVAEVVTLAASYQAPIIPYGGGTGVMGGTVPVNGGIVVDMKGLNRIIDIDPTGMSVVVEAGMILEDLARSLAEKELMIGHDPWSAPIATVGGAVSTNGVGYLAAKYGPMGSQVLGLDVVLPDGSVINTRALPKYSSGPNLNHIFIGSEGVFGLITRATLRLFRIPERQAFATVGFDSFDEGFGAVIELFAAGESPALLDLTEEGAGTVCLYLMFEGNKEEASVGLGHSLKVCSKLGGIDLGEDKTREYWSTRYDIARQYAEQMLDQPRSVRWQRGRWRFADYLHVALPVSRVLEYKRRCEELLSARGVEVMEYAIWGRPEFFSMLLGTSDGSGSKFGEGLGDAVDEVLRLAQDMGGSMEYCHGVGVKLAHLLPRDMGAGFEVAKAIKRALDPHNIMNPGKLF